MVLLSLLGEHQLKVELDDQRLTVLATRDDDSGGIITVLLNRVAEDNGTTIPRVNLKIRNVVPNGQSQELPLAYRIYKVGFQLHVTYCIFFTSILRKF